jgi:LPS-assembly protein
MMGRQVQGRSWGRQCAGLLVGLGLLAALAGPAQAQLIPPDFFDAIPADGSPAEVEANLLSYDRGSDLISAEGRVLMRYDGYEIECDDLRYNQRSGELYCIGNAAVLDPQGNRFTASRIEVTGGLKNAFVESLSVTTSDGALITARDTRYSRELETILTEATYAPCGLCIDEKGRRIGWTVRAARIVQDPITKGITIEQPRLEVLGTPVAWLPWLSLPDPSQKRRTGVRLPSLDYSGERGVSLTVPYFIALGEDTDLLLSPQLMSRQGFLMAAEWEQRFEYGRFNLAASGLYQFAPGAFAGEVGERDWRGAIQTSGEFELASDWKAGWSYTAFSDAAYLGDYDFNDDDTLINEVFATHLSDDFYADIRMQQYLVLGNYTEADQDMQALALPNARGAGYFDLGPNGQIRTNGSLLGVYRAAEQSDIYGTVPYVFGTEEQKLHATAEASWQNRYITSAGIVATPYLGVRLDAASLEGTSADGTLLTATPVAAIDLRYPMIAIDGLDTHLFEPIAQLAYRGSDETLVGLTNDNAHSFVLDDTNLFSYDRFSGTDRQETGLRANVGGRYHASFSSGGWLELMAGQSFHIAGSNAFDTADEVNVGVGSGLADDASYVVLGARGSPATGTTLGAKLQLDPGGPRVARAGLGGEVALAENTSIGGDYIYLPADSATGVLDDQHEITVRAQLPLADYWIASAGVSWDLAASEWLEATGELVYDDGYFLAGGYAKATGPTHTSPDSFSFGVKLALKGPTGEPAF